MSRPLPLEVARQIDTAYRRMAREAKYRPAAPSDGLGNITVPDSELDLEAECRDYATGWWEGENSLQFGIGCCNFGTRPAVIYVVEAARLLCGGGDDVARQLLRMALASLDGQPAS